MKIITLLVTFLLAGCAATDSIDAEIGAQEFYEQEALACTAGVVVVKRKSASRISKTYNKAEKRSAHCHR